MTSGEPEYRILIVCTGNICRSPLAERLLVRRFKDLLCAEDATRFDVVSAGTWGLVGEPMAPIAADCLVELGGDPSDFAARELSADLVRAADLILTATREHRAAVVTLDPTAARRTMTVREFSRLLTPVARDAVEATDPVDRFREVVAAAVANRGLVPIGAPMDDDIADPYGRSRSSYVRAANEIAEALTRPLDLLAPAGP